MAKILVIPDIHLQHEKAQRIIDMHEVDEVVLLGDYFDNWNDGPDSNRETAKWLKDALDRYTCLMGNHDQSYRFGKRHRCSGYTWYKQVAINSVMMPADWDKLQLLVERDGWYLSHAGWHRHFGAIDPEVLGLALDVAKRDGTVVPILGVGWERGGDQVYGGVTWCDWDEFQPPARTKHLVGHTKGPVVRHKGLKGFRSYCLDTGLRNFAILNDGDLELYEAQGF